MEKIRYHRANSKYKSGMIFVHKKNPKYIIKLVVKGKFDRWVCEVLSGEPAKNVHHVYNTDIPMDVSAGVRSWINQEGIRLVQYSTCAFNNCFVQSEMAEVLYREELV